MVDGADMTFDYARNAVVEDMNDLFFVYNGVNCGLEINGNLLDFELFYGEEILSVKGDFDTAVGIPFFGGRSIVEIFDQIADSVHFV